MDKFKFDKNKQETKKFDPQISDLLTKEGSEPKCTCSCSYPSACPHCAKGV